MNLRPVCRMGSARSTRALGETACEEGGFRRVSRVPEPLALARMRTMLLEAAAGGATLLEDGLAAFGEWKFLTTLCESVWSAGARRDSRASRRLLQRRLRTLGTRPVSFITAASLPSGSAVHLRGVVQRLSSNSPKAYIWSVSTIGTDNVRW